MRQILRKSTRVFSAVSALAVLTYANSDIQGPPVIPLIDELPVIVFGAAPEKTTSIDFANFALPEDAIEISPGVYTIADTQNGYIRQVKDRMVSVVAGEGTMKPNTEKAGFNTPTKPFPVLSLQPLGDGYLSFSSSGVGVNFHGPYGVEFIAKNYSIGASSFSIASKFTQRRGSDVIAIDANELRNTFVRVDRNGIQALDLGLDLSGLRIMGFDFCGDSIIFSHAKPGGDVTFEKFENGRRQVLFEDRPYSNAIKCLGEDDFLYGARWELKRYTGGETSVQATGFVHIASIRPALSTHQTFVITDSDAETITRLSLSGEREIIVTTKGHAFSDPFSKMEVIGNDIIGMTPDNTILRLHTDTGGYTVLLSPSGTGEWDSILRGYKFKSLRAFTYDDSSGVAYLGSNHGIFRLDTKAKTFEPFVGAENEYGNIDEVGLAARFTVVRDLLLNGDKLFVADAWNDKIRLVDTTTRKVTTYAGSGKSELKSSNRACEDRGRYNFNRPLALAMLDGKLIVANAHSHDLVAIDGEKACLFAGTPSPSDIQYGGGYVDGRPGKGQFSGPQIITTVVDGIVVSDRWNNALRHVDRTGRIKTLYQDEKMARMISAVAKINGRYYFGSADSTVKALTVPTSSASF